MQIVWLRLQVRSTAGDAYILWNFPISGFWLLSICDCSKILWTFMAPSDSPYIQYFHPELLVDMFSVLLCVLIHCFASNTEFFRSNNYSSIHMNLIFLIITYLNSLCFSFYLLDVHSWLKTLCFALNHVDLWTGFVRLMNGTLSMVRPSAIAFCMRRFLLY